MVSNRMHGLGAETGVACESGACAASSMGRRQRCALGRGGNVGSSATAADADADADACSVPLAGTPQCSNVCQSLLSRLKTGAYKFQNLMTHRAVVLEMIGDLPEADSKPPTNMLFVCKLNAVRS